MFAARVARLIEESSTIRYRPGQKDADADAPSYVAQDGLHDCDPVEAEGMPILLP